MASQTLILQNPNLPRTTILSHPSTLIYSKPRTISFSSRPNSLAAHILKSKKFTVSASSSTVLENPSANLSTKPSITPNPLITRSTRTITTLFAVTLAVSKLVFNKLIFNGLGQSLAYTAGPMFFAALRDQPTTGGLNTPFTVVAAGMAKWLDIYSGVLMVRVLLSWFPNIPWDRQPLSAIRDLCDPYLNLFRNIIPPIFDTLDVSPLLAFAVLGTLGSILNSSRGGY
ncbi:ylmG homolog protein 1-2, chloroplastic-like [Lycium barbarum]|uniref:ylmG homolog protein 1-2, chloroplastic-like n=1 Tax=Lycium ferocissimum TaxID=112874 RepID=UPI002815C665|nr:ylmG homolog protein 1-2, chloroplastic-like [Lycium ferocissimum]XP_060176658.1 ylmG homolog protein 1-2, chloroplastic-like [Lycium barbarum]